MDQLVQIWLRQYFLTFWFENLILNITKFTLLIANLTDFDLSLTTLVKPLKICPKFNQKHFEVSKGIFPSDLKMRRICLYSRASSQGW